MAEKIEIQLGKSTTLSFNSLATAGYAWQFEIGKAGIISVEKTANNKDISKMPIGVSLDELFIIKGIGIGASALEFRQSRSWETNSKPVQIKTYQILVVE